MTDELTDKEKEMITEILGGMLKDEIIKMMEKHEKSLILAAERFATINAKLDVLIAGQKK